MAPGLRLRSLQPLSVDSDAKGSKTKVVEGDQKVLNGGRNRFLFKDRFSTSSDPWFSSGI